jgi:hypothetical protein
MGVFMGFNWTFLAYLTSTYVNVYLAIIPLWLSSKNRILINFYYLKFMNLIK